VAARPRDIKVPTGAVLSKYLRALALDIETMDDDGNPVTKAAALAMLVWKYALGFEDKVNGTKEVHPPDWRAIEVLYNRIEGKIPLAVVEEMGGHSLTEKVTDLGRARANSLAKAAAADDTDGVDEDGRE
jgi:hypothetical protein